MIRSRKGSRHAIHRQGEDLDRVAFPLGGIGAGMLSLEGNGALAQVSLRHKPDIHHEPQVFAALHVKGVKTARVLEGPVPMWKVSGTVAAVGNDEPGNGLTGRTYGLPRFAQAEFQARFPFASVALTDPDMPVSAELTGWSPFTPGASDDSSLPVAAIEYRFVNRSKRTAKAVFSFHAANLMRVGEGASVQVIERGFVLCQAPVANQADAEGGFAVFTDDAATTVDAAWFRGGWFDAQTMLWNQVASGACLSRPPHAEGAPGRGGSLYVPFTLKPGGERTIRLAFAWHVPRSLVRTGRSAPPGPEPFLADGWRLSRLMPAMDVATAPYVGAGADAGWEDFPAGTEFLDVHQRRGPDGLVYLARSLTCAEACERVLHVGHDGGVRVFVDGAPVAATAGTINPAPGTRTQARVRLSAGVHEICVALDRAGGKGYGIFVSLQKPAEGCAGACACSGPVEAEFYTPWYATRFPDLAAVTGYWRANYERLRVASLVFSDCFHDTTLPAEVVESVAANLAILKSPTCLRQADGRLWGWEGCCGASGCCPGSCTHVWNYAQSIPHLFPDLERSLRETEFLVSQDGRGHQNFRSDLPIRKPHHDFHAAADGQLGGLMKLHREWRISGDTAWLRRLWPAARRSLDYAIATWDPQRGGTLVEPHHNTYDIEFWGADGMCTSFYLGALAAAIAMGEACGDEVAGYRELLGKGRAALETTLWNGSWFIQRVQWEGLRATSPQNDPAYSPEARAILGREGPKYQYGTGCLSDGILGDWMARTCGIGPIVDRRKVARHLAAVFKHNFRVSLSDHANPQRPGYAFPQEGGLLLCSWPKGGKPSLPFVYSDEVWTGIEYQVASHLIMTGQVEAGLQVVRALRRRYDGRWRNPFDEYECGHWYARAMASYGLLQACTGARYDAVEQVLHLDPRVEGDFRAFLCTASGFGTVGLRQGKPFVEVAAGSIPVRRFVIGG